MMKTQAEYIGEIFLHTSKLNTEQEKIKYLRSVSNRPLKMLLRYAYDDSITSNYKEVPSYEPDDSPIGYSFTGLHKEYKILPYFFNTEQFIKNDKVRDKKLRNLFEVINWTETAILEALILKKELPHISKELAFKAFPDLMEMK